MERTVKVTVLANVTGALGQLALLRQGVRDFSSELQKSAVDRKATFQDMAIGLLAVGAVLGGVTALAVKKFADFDQAMSHVEAVTRETAFSMELLREAALKAGAETQFTALEAAKAIEELAKAGVTTADILSGGLAASLNLAASSGLSVARSAEIAAGALGMFQLKGSDLADVTDYLAAGANKSIGEVDDLALALRQVGPVAFQTGLSIKETVGALAAFASTGRIGQDAGTSFKRMLQLLTPQSAQAEAEMKRLGISGYNAQGQFIGLANYAGVLHEKLKDLTPEARNAAFAVMYGSDAVNAASEVYRQGKDGIQEWIDKVDDTGYAADNAALRLGNLKGDVEQFGGSLDTLFVTMGEAANGPLRGIVQFGTDAVNALGETSDEFQQMLFWTGAIAGGILLMNAAFALGVPKIAAYHNSVKLLTEQFPKLGAAISAMGRVGGWATLALIGITALNFGMDAYRESLRKSTTELTNMAKVATSGVNIIKQTLEGIDIHTTGDSLQGLWDADAITTATEAANDFQPVLDGLMEKKAEWNGSPFKNWIKPIAEDSRDWSAVSDRMTDLGKSLAGLAADDLPAAQNSFKLLFEQTDQTEESFWNLLSLMPDYKDALTRIATTMGVDATDAQSMMNIAMGEGAEGAEAQRYQLERLKGAADDASGGIADLAKQVSEFGQTTFDTREATRKTEEAFDDLNDQIKAASEAGYTYADMLDITSAAGRDTTEDMDNYARAINDAAAAMYTQNGSIDEMTGYLATQRQQLYDVALQLYGNSDAAWAYVDSLIATPEDITTTAHLNGIPEADRAIRSWYENWNGKKVHMSLDVNGNTLVHLPGGTALYASGGTVYGPGTGTSDSIPAWLSNGEEVINAASAARWRPLLKAINANKVGALQLANGGTAGKTYAKGYGQYMTSPSMVQGGGDTFQLNAQVTADPGMPVADQIFMAAKRLQVRVKSRRG